MQLIFNNSKIRFVNGAPYIPIVIDAVSSHNILNVPVGVTESETTLQYDTMYRCRLYKNGQPYNEPIQVYKRTSAYTPNSGGGAQGYYNLYPINGVYTVCGYNDLTAWLSFGKSTSPSTREVDRLVTQENSGFITNKSVTSGDAKQVIIAVSDEECISKGILKRGETYKFRVYNKGEQVTDACIFCSRNSSFVIGTGGGLISQNRATSKDGIYEYTIDPSEATIWLQIGSSDSVFADTVQIVK
jgi:hypothetical protein